ncbi:hypothetical protein V6N13_086728 [Hibiscus sabdariffa]
MYSSCLYMQQWKILHREHTYFGIQSSFCFPKRCLKQGGLLLDREVEYRSPESRLKKVRPPMVCTRDAALAARLRRANFRAAP